MSERFHPGDLQTQLRREQRKLELVQDIALAVGTTFDLDNLLKRIAENVTELIDAERSTIYVAEPDKRELWSTVALSDGAPVEIRLPFGTGVAGWVAAEARVLNVPDAYSDERFDPTWDQTTGYTTRSLLGAPMITSAGEIVGVIQVLNKKGDRAFTADDEIYLQAIAGQAAMSLQNAQLVRSLQQNIEELRDTRDQLEQRNQELDLLLELEQLSS